ncbi:MAG: hypothetical protein ACOCQI_01735 [Desulfosalsimonas sp.]
MNPSQGAPTDPVTGRPLEEQEAARTRELNEREERRYQKQAQYADIDRSEAAEALRDMIRGLLEKRVAAMIEEDREAAAYVEILKKMKERSDLAKRAVEKLVKHGKL